MHFFHHTNNAFVTAATEVETFIETLSANKTLKTLKQDFIITTEN